MVLMKNYLLMTVLIVKKLNMLSNKEIVCPNNLLDLAQKKEVKAGIVNAGILKNFLN